MRYFWVLMVSLFLWGTSATLYAQISVNFNIGVQPIWGPTGYDYVEYYYLPDIDAYYYVPEHRFYYYEGWNWIYGSSLPSRYGNYDLYNSYKVVVNERDPWRNDETYRREYASYKGRHDQQPIRDSRDSKYFVNKDHPQHNVYIQQQKQNNGNHFGQNKGNVTPIRNNKTKITKLPVDQKPVVIKQQNGNQRSPVIRKNTVDQRPTVTNQKTVNQRPTVVKQNNGNKGNNGKGNVKGNDKGNGKENKNNGNGKDK